MWAIVLNFYQATHVSLIQNESYQQSREKMKNNGEHKRPYQHFSLLSSFTNAMFIKNTKLCDISKFAKN